MKIEEYYCKGTMMSHEADYWRSKLIDQSFPLFGIAEREDYIAIGFLELNDLIHARFVFSDFPEIILGEDCIVFPRHIAGLLEFSQMLSACSGRFKKHDLSTLHVAFLSIGDRDEFIRLLDGKMKPC
jgi:hypothetical protein